MEGAIDRQKVTLTRDNESANDRSGSLPTESLGNYPETGKIC